MIEVTHKAENWQDEPEDRLHFYDDEEGAVDALHRFAGNMYADIKKVLLLDTYKLTVEELEPKLDGYKIRLVAKKVNDEGKPA